MANRISDVLEDIKRLEPFPRAAIRVLELSLNDADPDEITSVVQEDTGLTGKVLRLVNSSLCGLFVPVESIDHAVRLLGSQGVASLAMTTGVASFFMGYGDSTPRSNRSLWEESLHTALLARAIAREVMPPKEAELAYTVGLLQNMGHVVLDRFLETEMDAILSLREDGVDPLRAERMVLGLDHVRCATLIGRRWELPDRLVKGIHFHHAPAAAREDREMCEVVNLAEGMTWNEIARKETSLVYPPSRDIAGLVQRLQGALADIGARVRSTLAEFTLSLS